MKHVIVPFFISHQGCPHQCVFCDQRTISGNLGKLPDADELTSRVTLWLSSSALDSLEVAFYGGSFTALPFDTQLALLLPLQPLKQSGKVCSIRVSTRPDALSMDSLQQLRDLGVDLVELGVQSMDDRVLEAAGRGHDASQTVEAFALLRERGFKVGAQLMPGLPGDSAEGAIRSLQEILSLKPDLLRIYPTVILKGTRLAEMYLDGCYQPLTLHEAIRISKVMLHEAATSGVPVIRAGLQPTDELSYGGEIVAGPYHPAFRQLAEGERWYDLLDILFAELESDKSVTLKVPEKRVSDVVGQNRINIRCIEEKYGILVSALNGDTSLENNDFLLSTQQKVIAGNLLQDLGYEGLRPYKKERF